MVRIGFDITKQHVFNKVQEELERANTKYQPLFHSTHEGFAVLKEEVDELWEEVKNNDQKRAKEEALQVAAMAVKFILSLQEGVEES